MKRYSSNLAKKIKEHLPLGLLLLAFAGLAFLFSLTIPLSKAPDEYVHFLYTQFLAEHGRPPISVAEQQAAGYKSDQPPLYHYLVALATAPIDRSEPPRFKFSWEPASRQLIDIILPRALLIRTENETWPLAGVFLVWMAGRWLSIVIGGLTVLITYFIIRQIFPGQYWLAVGAAGTLAFIPRFIFTSSVLSDDNLIGLLMALFLYVVVKLFADRQKLSLSTAYALMGIIVGLALSTKYTVLPVPIELIALTLWLAQRQQWKWRTVVSRLALFGFTLILVTSAWYSFLWINFNEIEQQGFVMGLLRPIMAGGNNPEETGAILNTVTGGGVALEFTEGNAWDWMRTLFTQFWNVPIFGVPQPYPLQIVLSFALLLCGLAVMGWWRRWYTGPKIQRSWLGLLLLHLMIFLPIPLVRFLAIGDIHDTAQARHLLFPAAPAAAILLVAGVSGLVAVRWQRWVISGVVLGMLLLTLAHLYYYTTGFPDPLPVRTDPTLAATPAQSAAATFGSSLHLRGFDWAATNSETLDVTLHWRLTTPVSQDYLTELRLERPDGSLARRWLSHPAGGRFPTRAWDAGDSVRDALSLPLTGLDAGDYRLYLRLLDWAGEPLPAANSEETNSVLLTTVSLAAQPPAQAAQLWQQGRPAENEPVYRYRATIPVTAPVDQPAALVAPRPGGQIFEPHSRSGNLSLFLVTHTWPSGQYRLLLDGRPTETQLWVENFEWTFTAPEMMTRVEANFGDAIKLLGYDLPLRRVEPGGGIPLVLYWQSLRQMQADYTIAVQLLDAGLQRRGGYDRIPRETYNTSLWVPGEVVADGFAVPVDPDAPPGVYQILLGLYQEEAGQPQPLPLVQNGALANSTSVSIGPIKVGGAPPGVVLSPTQATPNMPLSLELGQPPVIALLGYDLVPDTEMVRVTLYWQSLAQTSVDWTVFVHGRNQAGQTVIQRDGPAGSGLYPTSLWDSGEIIADEIAVPLPEDFAPGQYDLVIGLYNLADGVRLHVPDSIHNEIILSRWEFSGS